MKATGKLLREREPELCFSCHPEKQAQAFYPSHHPIDERKVACSDCHAPHGSQTRGLVRADSTNELCAKCHQAKEGPFVFEHPPATEDCAICHEPHGTIADNLLRQSEPFLCLGCHTGHQGPLPPLTDVIEVAEKRASFYTRCTQCHETVHGSDLPSTTGHGRFTR
jgi:DmsE family decaheme c-type cytochrome